MSPDRPTGLGRLRRQIAAIPLALEASFELVIAGSAIRLPEAAYFRFYGLAVCGGEPADLPGSEPDFQSAVPAYPARMVTRVANLGAPPARCLARALAGYRMLRRRGHRPVVRFGLRAGDEGGPVPLRAHAWLTLHGEVVVGGCGDLLAFDEIARFS